jgi:hypothetical protein
VKIGISKPRDLSPEDFLLSSAHRDSVDVSEWDALDLLEVSSRTRSKIFKTLHQSRHRTVISVSSAYLFRNPEASQERLEILSEMADIFSAMAVLVRWSKTPTNEVFTLPRLAGGTEWWIDSGRELPEAPHEPATANDSRPAVVIDPLWHSISRTLRAPVFKLHGWHTSRWVRHYGPEQLLRLLKLCHRHEPRAVLFAHSMRNHESLSFLRLLHQSDEPALR